MQKTVSDIATLTGGRVLGDPGSLITGVATLVSAGPHDIAFIESDRQMDQARASSAGCVLVPDFLTVESKTTIQTLRPRLAFAIVVDLFHPPPPPLPGIHPSAILAETASLGPDVTVGPGVVIQAGVSIGARTVLGSHVTLGRDSKLGADCVLHPQVTLYPNVELGDRVVVHAGTVLGSDGFGYMMIDGVYRKFPQVGKLIIEDDVEIGSNVSIDRGTLDATIIRRGTKIDNLTQVAHNVEIGEDCVLAAQVGAAGSARIEDRAVIGGQVGIADHVTIGEGAIVGAQAGIPSGKRIHPGEFVWGTPARPMHEFKAQFGSLARLPRIRAEMEDLKRRLAQLEQHLQE